VHSKINLSSGRGGKLFKHHVILQLIRLNDYYSTRYKFFHHRVRDNDEIDLIMHRSSTDPTLAIEIKVDGSPSASDLRTLRHFKKEHSQARCYCLTAGDATYEIDGVKVCGYEAGIQEIFQLGLEGDLET